MADKKITELTAETSADKADLIPIVTDTDSTAVTKKITVANLMGGLIAPEGFLINGKIVPSVTSGNLTVAIKGLNGSDPSATNPVYIRIGDTIRSITSALSVTKNAGTNWFNAGSAELATQEIDYFVYLGYNATDGVVLGFSRIPFASEYDDFSATTTNEKYCAISTITNATAGDDYVNIGRFAATLSAGAGYTWSVPTFTNKNLIQRPIFETRWLTYLPKVTPSGTMTHNGTPAGTYVIKQNTCLLSAETGSGTIGGTASSTFTFSLPIRGSTVNTYKSFYSYHYSNGSFYVGTAHYDGSTHSDFITRYYTGANYTTGANQNISTQGTYII